MPNNTETDRAQEPDLTPPSPSSTTRAIHVARRPGSATGTTPSVRVLPVNGTTTFWTAEGRYRWHADEANLLSGFLGHGPLDGHGPSSAKPRDTVTLASNGNLMILVPQMPFAAGPAGMDLALSYRVLPLAGQIVDDDGIGAATAEQWGPWMGEVVEHAFDRGDAVFIEHMISTVPQRTCTVVRPGIPNVLITTHPSGYRTGKRRTEIQAPLSRNTDHRASSTGTVRADTRLVSPTLRSSDVSLFCSHWPLLSIPVTRGSCASPANGSP